MLSKRRAAGPAAEQGERHVLLPAQGVPGGAHGGKPRSERNVVPHAHAQGQRRDEQPDHLAHPRDVRPAP